MEKEIDNNNLERSHGLKKTLHRVKMGSIALVPIVVLGAMIAYLFGPGQTFLNKGIASLPEVSFERIEFQEGKIVTLIRNTGPNDIAIVQADINDRIHPAAVEPGRQLSRLAVAKVIIPFPWNAGEPYEIGITTSDGTRFSKSVTAAAPAANPTAAQASFFALIGIYVGIIPVLIGLLWFPLIRRLGTNAYRFFLSLTAGLLVFLGIDAVLESNSISSENIAGVFNGQILIAMTVILSFLVLHYVSEKLVSRIHSRITTLSGSSTGSMDKQEEQQQQQQLIRPVAIALMVSIGIGLHNFGEGLAIGAAVVLGEAALGTFLIVGFTLHNTTEGLAIVAPMAKVAGARKILTRKLIILGLIAGAPTILGTWVGGFFYSPIAAIIFLSIGAGAIFQVVFAIYSSVISRSSTKRTKMILSDMHSLAGFAMAMVIMYVTGLLVSS